MMDPQLDTAVWDVREMPTDRGDHDVALDQFRTYWTVHGFPDPRERERVVIEIEELCLNLIADAGVDAEALLREADHVLLDGLEEMAVNTEVLGQRLDRVLILHTVWIDDDSPWKPTEVEVVTRAMQAIMARHDPDWALTTGVVTGAGTLWSEAIQRLGFLRVAEMLWFVRLSREPFCTPKDEEDEDERPPSLNSITQAMKDLADGEPRIKIVVLLDRARRERDDLASKLRATLAELGRLRTEMERELAQIGKDRSELSAAIAAAVGAPAPPEGGVLMNDMLTAMVQGAANERDQLRVVADAAELLVAALDAGVIRDELTDLREKLATSG